ncbi:putative uncharacterized protein [Firmicutes bacterium CAG:212]|nr:putative uncharacterized protein [Firmicutes bacterium CAG:212]
MEKIKKLFQTTGTKQGSFSIGVTAIVIAIVVVANMIIGQLPEKYRNIDVSSTKIYEISDTSKDLLKELDHKVTLTVLAVKDETDDRITTFLSKYAGLSKNVSVKWIDPVLHPSALTENNAEKDTIVVKCEDTGKSTTVAFSDIIVQDMSSYYYTGSASESEFDGEGQLTSAINYVISDASQTVYRTSGHGESTFSTTISDLMKKNNYNVEELNLVMNTEIPDDCDLLMMYAPTNDLSQEEADVMKNYLKSGGKVMLILGDTTSEQLPNLMGILSDYGMKEADGYIADPKRCYQGNAYYLFPQLSVSGDLANGISSQMVLLVNTHGLELSDPARDTISVNAFMSTTNNAYAVTEDAQTEGSYTLGAVATESISKDDAEDENSTDDSETLESRLTVISSASMIDSQITDAFTTLENTTLFMNAVTANFDGVKNISIEPKSLSVEYNTVKHSGLLSLLVIFGVPIVLLIGGFSVWYRRRKA